MQLPGAAGVSRYEGFNVTGANSESPVTIPPSMTAGGMTSVRLSHISKKFGSTLALDNIDLEIKAGELFFLLGPSGCGKSTLLRLIAGLHDPSAGKILFNDRDVTSLATDKRNAVMCFQSYALWPHMSVRDNVAFGLDVRHVPPGELAKRVEEVLAMVQLTALADRKPNQLSGGQQQRVALARALAVKPDCLLLDEPLSNLDAKLRLEMRTEIRRICKTAGFTTIYVTHDQKEALSVADRIAILKDGKLMQVGTPGELYHTPATSFVAGFIGQTNLLPGKVVSRDAGMVTIESAAGMLTVASMSTASAGVVSIRPEQMRVAQNTESRGANRITGTVLESIFLGEASEHVLAVHETKIKVICTPPIFQPPQELTVEFDPKDGVFLSE
jgi:iron(III) transport system ATP-binding protein